MPKAIQRVLRFCAIGVFTLGIAGCSPWGRVAGFRSWTLYALPGPDVDVDAFEAAFEPAMELVEAHLGPFPRPVRVHAWPGNRSGAPRLTGLPGGGAARVPAWHQRGGDWTLPEGIYVTVPDTGDAIHEAVHAWFAVQDVELPLWFEEGLAIYLADGVLTAEGWVIDGLATWPWEQLRQSNGSPEEIERLLQVGPGAEPWEDLFLHFVGWAAVFDLALQDPAESAEAALPWERWWQRARQESPQVLGQRVLRTLSPQTPKDWWSAQRMRDSNQRRAAALGLGRLGSASLARELFDASRSEADSQVRRSLLLCAAASGAESLLPAGLRRDVGRALRSEAEATDLDPAEREAMELLGAGFLGQPLGSTRANQAWSALRGYWDD